MKFIEKKLCFMNWKVLDSGLKPADWFTQPQNNSMKQRLFDSLLPLWLKTYQEHLSNITWLFVLTLFIATARATASLHISNELVFSLPQRKRPLQDSYYKPVCESEALSLSFGRFAVQTCALT